MDVTRDYRSELEDYDRTQFCADDNDELGFKRAEQLDPFAMIYDTAGNRAHVCSDVLATIEGGNCLDDVSYTADLAVEDFMNKLKLNSGLIKSFENGSLSGNKCLIAIKGILDMLETGKKIDPALISRQMLGDWVVRTIEYYTKMLRQLHKAYLRYLINDSLINIVQSRSLPDIERNRQIAELEYDFNRYCASNLDASDSSGPREAFQLVKLGKEWKHRFNG
jgi:hypothetical protein